MSRAEFTLLRDFIQLGILPMNHTDVVLCISTCPAAETDPNADNRGNLKKYLRDRQDEPA